MTESLSAEVKTHFYYEQQPLKEELVVWDGFDEFEKSDAVEFFNGKTWEDVLHHLQNPIVSHMHYLEEWCVLSKKALTYYLCGYLEFLIETLSRRDPDEHYISEFFHYLYQTVYIHKGSPFSHDRTNLVLRIAEHVAVEIKDLQRFSYAADHIEENIDLFFKELAKYHD